MKRRTAKVFIVLACVFFPITIILAVFTMLFAEIAGTVEELLDDMTDEG